MVQKAPENISVAIARMPDADALLPYLRRIDAARYYSNFGPLVQEFEARIAADGNDHDARIELSKALLAAGRREDAVNQLLESIRRTHDWNDDAARKQLLTLFEAFGHADELTVSGRRQLSSILFS